MQTFRDMAEAVEAIRSVERDYSTHAEAALAIAHEYFDSDKVLTQLVQTAMCQEKPAAAPEVAR